MSLLDFQSRIASSLLKEKKKGPGRRRSDTVVLAKRRKVGASLPPIEIMVDHFPTTGDKQQRCKNCINVYTRIYCNTCPAYLCLVIARNCFYDFHKNCDK